MLQAIRSKAGSFVVKGLFGLLILTFGVWGIGDIFRGFGVFTVAKIGKTEISIDQFRQQYNERLQQLGQQMRRPITPDQARALGLEQRILGTSQQPLMNLGEARAGACIRGILRLRGQIQFQRIVALRVSEPIRRQCGGRARQ